MTSMPSTLDEVLDITRDSGRDVVNVDAPTVKIVMFEAGGACFAVRGAGIGEILPYGRVFPVPGCPAAIEGAINVRGDIESVIRLAALLGLKDDLPGRHTAILLARGAGLRSGLRVDRILDVVDVPETAIVPPLATISEQVRPVAAGMVLQDGRAATLIDLDLLFQCFQDGSEAA